ncbi:hypothetical protein A0256_13975 [Mucilaginibacter sp. PAMC 26640]|nr:hypothetical protein A0256_13975 [Mucilaginibacter sp. PAMC 26640]
MNKLFHLHCFEALKTEVLSVCKIDSVTLSDCRTISFLVMKQTQKCINEITLKRLFGFMISNFPSSLYTLDALSLFCGHNNWEVFCEVHTKDSSINSEQIVKKLVKPNSDSVQITSFEQLLNDPLVSALLNGGPSTFNC